MKSGLAEQKFDGLSSPFVDVNSTSYNPQARNDVGNMMSNLPYGQITTKQQQPQQSARQVPRQDRLGPSRVLGFSQESQAESMVSRSQTYQGPLMNQSGQQRTPSKAVPSTIPRTAGLAFNEDPTTMQRHLLSESRVSYTPGGSSQQGFPPRSSRQRPERTMNMVPRPLFGQVAMPQQRTVPGQAQQQQQPKVYSSSRVPHESARNNQGQQHQLYTYKDDPVPFHPAFPSQVQHNSHQAPIAPQNFDLLGSATSRSFSNTASGLASRRLSTIAPVPQGSYLAVPDSSSPQHTIAEPTRGMMISEDAERLRARHNSTRMPQQQAALQQYQQNGSQPVQMLPRFSQPAPIPSYRPPYPAEGFRRSSSQQPFSGSRIRTVCEICGGSEKHAYDCPYNNT
ncbi:hypothetical protein BKA65DRAFT_205114 [Rhexocercosporidium sp. MPI-PUGE-AT-0058]|nr:hypothetical protein BKA65DRAFT_205114 [Rhexocercosporidium sp. MPI-PUGE-AT-0058]